MDLDIRDCLGRVKLVLQQNYIGRIWLFVLILERGKPLSNSGITQDRFTNYLGYFYKEKAPSYCQRNMIPREQITLS